MSDLLKKLNDEHKARRAKFFPQKETVILELKKQPEISFSVVEIKKTEPPKIVSLKMPLTIIRVIQIVVKRKYGFSRLEIISKNRKKNVTLSRHISMYFSKKMTNLSLVQIGIKFGRRDHTTVLHAVRGIEKKMEKDVKLKEEIDQMEKEIYEIWQEEKKLDKAASDAKAKEAGALEEITLEMSDAGSLVLSRIKDDVADGNISLRDAVARIYLAMRESLSSPQSAPISASRFHQSWPAAAMTRDRRQLERQMADDMDYDEVCYDDAPPNVDSCEMCGASFAGVDFWHATVPVERWLCTGCNTREGGAMKKGDYRSTHYPND